MKNWQSNQGHRHKVLSMKYIVGISSNNFQAICEWFFNIVQAEEVFSLAFLLVQFTKCFWPLLSQEYNWLTQFCSQIAKDQSLLSSRYMRLHMGIDNLALNSSLVFNTNYLFYLSRTSLRWILVKRKKRETTTRYMWNTIL